MRRIVWVEYVALDGVVEDPAWTGPFWSDELEEMQRQQLFRSDGLLLGRVTYDAFAASWPQRTDDGTGFTDRINSMPKHVASRTLSNAQWNATVLEGDVVDAVRELKQGSGGDLVIYGSTDLVDSLMPHDLIDEYRLMLFPVVVGHGKRAFRDGVDTKALRLANSKVMPAGVVVLSYEPTG